MNELIEYLRNNLLLDFQGDLTVELVREFLKGDDSRDSRQLVAKLVAERGVDDMLIVLADCLVDAARKAVTDDIMREQLRNYAES